uniref:Coiled-coil domain containing 138 n=1 Tax=Mastacembelus armatus TaxID=205130 RepID=A0A7N8YDG6_9TELE
MNAAKYRDILEENLFQSAQDLRLGRRFTFQQDNDPKHTAKITKEWHRNNSVTVLDWSSQSPDLNPIEHLWRDLKMAVHQRSPSNLTELERICKEEWQRIPKSRCEKLVASFPRRLMAVLQQLSHLQDLLRERSKENKRLKNSFDTIKELNDNMKKQLNELSEQNEKLESQSKRLQARLENLQVITQKLIFFMFYNNWSYGKPEVLLNLLRLIHWALRQMDNNTQHVSLSATLRRIGEEVSKPASRSTVQQFENPDLPKSCSESAGSFRSWPLYRSPCPQTRILSTLIILRTVTQADVVAQALDNLHTELMTVESRGLFIHHGGLCVLLSVLQAGRGGLHRPIDILMQLIEPSRYLNPFLVACSCEGFFRTASQLLKHPRLELPSLEKFSMLLQKLSSIRKNHRLFELSSLHLQLQELYHKTNHTRTFLCLNLRSILHNLK